MGKLILYYEKDDYLELRECKECQNKTSHPYAFIRFMWGWVTSGTIDPLLRKVSKKLGVSFETLDKAFSESEKELEKLWLDI